MTMQLKSVIGNVGQEQRRKLELVRSASGLTISRLVGIAIYNELQKPEPFKLPSLPDEEMEEYAYADQASKIITWLKKTNVALTLDHLMIVHEDMGIATMDEFLYGFKEALDNNLIVKSKPSLNSKYPQGTILYKAWESKEDKKKLKKKNKEANEYEQYLKLQKKFGDK